MLHTTFVDKSVLVEFATFPSNWVHRGNSPLCSEPEFLSRFYAYTCPICVPIGRIPMIFLLPSSDPYHMIAMRSRSLRSNLPVHLLASPYFGPDSDSSLPTDFPSLVRLTFRLAPYAHGFFILLETLHR